MQSEPAELSFDSVVIDSWLKRESIRYIKWRNVYLL